MSDLITYGTYPLMGQDLNIAVRSALDAGYTRFDTSQMAGNEVSLGAALKSSGRARDDFKVTTKIAPRHYGRSSFIPSLRQSLDRLQLDRVDLLLLHFPPSGRMMSCLELLASAMSDNLAAAIGISNFTPTLMREAATSGLPISTNQIEFHPLINGKGLLEATAETGIPLQAFSPLARGAVLSHPAIGKVARACKKTPAQVALRWIIQHGLSVVTHSSNARNLVSNLGSADFELDEHSMRIIDGLAGTNYRVVSQDYIKWAPIWD